MGIGLAEDMLDLPGPSPLPNSHIQVPHFFIGDGIFGLKKYLLVPYSRSINMPYYEKVFNYRLSRARRQIECAFGTMVSKWKILEQPLDFKLETSELIIMSLICIHNFVITMELKLPRQEHR